MLGIVYLIICFLAGAVICKIFLPRLVSMSETAFNGKKISIPSFFITLPVWYFTGTMVMTWSSYLLGYAFKSQSEPLKYADAIVMPLAALLIAVYFIKNKNKTAEREFSIKFSQALYFFTALVLVTALMFRTFYIRDGKLCVGLSVFSDFSPHLGMIRSFSYGNNFPTAYSHYAGEDIKYHFMFQFLVGNLEYLGLRIDMAFNIPSILNMMGVYCLLYVLAVKITGKNAVGIIAGLLFTFRSSPSFFKYIAAIPKGTDITDTLFSNIEFIGETANESWGLWNLNVYCNQRHFAFSLSIMLFSIMVFLEHYYKQRERFEILYNENKLSKGIKAVKENMAAWLFCKESWQIVSIKRALFMGVLLGMSAFFNGAVLICTLAVMFVLAIASDNRLEILITAVTATGMSLLESAFFINGSAVSPKYLFGFIAPNKTIFGVTEYIFELTGAVPLVIAAALIVLKKSEKYVTAAFLMPFVLAFTLSLTPDVTVNHKNIMLSLMLLGIFMADVIVKLFENKGFFSKLFAAVLIIIMTVTGIYDCDVLFRRNADGNNLKYALDDELMLWIKENTDSKDIFLTHNYYLNNMVLGGAMLYDGWQYYAWSAGYDTAYRDGVVSQIYGADNEEELAELVEGENIRYIVVDYNNRNSADYVLNEEVISAAYEKVYEQGNGEWQISVYDTSLKK